MVDCWRIVYLACTENVISKLIQVRHQFRLQIVGVLETANQGVSGELLCLLFPVKIQSVRQRTT